LESVAGVDIHSQEVGVASPCKTTACRPPASRAIYRWLSR
jgi:hypothetical protein